MVCRRLRELEQAIIARGIRETFRGQAWSQNCREWVYFDCYLDTAAIRRRFQSPERVREHAHRGAHDGQERGFECARCHDGVMGDYAPSPGTPTFPD